MSQLEQLLEMGFPRTLAEEALNNTGNSGLEAAMDWIVEHQGDTHTEDDEGTNPSPEEKKESKPQIMSYNCEDCKKQLRNEDEVQLHSARTGHVNFSESSDQIKPLTEEERKAQMEKLQAMLRQKKAEREASETVDDIEREKRRREQGKNIVSAKIKFQEDEMRRMAEERRREKAADKLYRAELVAKIAKEREEKKLREQQQADGTPPVQEPTKPLPVVQPVKTDYNQCRLQFRLPNGHPVKAEFSAKEPLSAVILYISQNWPGVEADPSALDVFTTFPKREFSLEERQQSLSDLGLCPSAVLNVRRRRV